jgi:hypothetical protein
MISSLDAAGNAFWRSAEGAVWPLDTDRKMASTCRTFGARSANAMPRSASRSNKTPSGYL